MSALMVLVLDNACTQRCLGNGRWQDVEMMKEPIKRFGLTGVMQEIHEPGWRFDATLSGLR
ncbi:hypothetical protein SB861_54040 [Paraburkholderia sp. SIMBA_049]